MSYLDQLPLELLSLIIVQLDLTDIWRLARVSPFFASLCRTWNLWADKAHQDFGLPRKLFFATKLTDPRLQYWQMRYFHKDVNQALGIVAPENQVDMIKYLISRGATDLNITLAIAARYNCVDTVDYLISQGADINRGLIGAGVGGHRDLAQKLLAQGASDRDFALALAAAYDQVEMIEYLMTQGATDVNLAFREAAKAGRVNALQYLRDHGATDVNTALIAATESGSTKGVEYIVGLAETNPNAAIVSAVRQNHLEILKILIKHGANVSQALNWAQLEGRCEMIDYLQSLGSNRIG